MSATPLSAAGLLPAPGRRLIAGLVAGSVALIGFRLDSGIEGFSSAIII